MGKRTTKESDHWFGIDDPRKRKQIQDRLAQRARRKRLAENGAASKSERSLESSQVLSKKTSKPKCLGTSDANFMPNFSASVNVTCIISSRSSQHQPLSRDHSISMPRHTIYSALFQNGVILGLACGSATFSKSRPAAAHVPEPLRPTQLQKEVIHYEMIDRFPLPALREKMITFSDVLNVEDFLADIFTNTTFIIAPGRESWDPTAWKPSNEFKQKWRYLF